MRIDPNSAVPVFRQIVQEIQSMVAAGIYREGEAIPSARELSMQLNVNPNTIQKAFDELDQLGVVETRRGIGKFVCKGAGKNSIKRTCKELQELFLEGIQKGQAAGLTGEQINQIFDRAARRARSTPKAGVVAGGARKGIKMEGKSR